MTADRPFHTAAQLAQRFGLGLQGDGDVRVSGVATLAGARPGELAFLANPRYRAQLPKTRASVVVVRAGDADTDFQGTLLLADDPYVAFARIGTQTSSVAPG